jgi:hypothetical protein
VSEGEIIPEDKLKTAFGIFNLSYTKNIGEKLQLLLIESPSPFGRGARGEGEAQIQFTVEDVLFKQNQFQIKGRGGLVIHMKDAPRIGDVITVQVQVKCLS